MVKVIDILHSIIKQINEQMPKSKHELGEYTGENDTFCYYLPFVKSKQNTKFTKETLIDIQIIYHGNINYVGQTSLKEKLDTKEKLEYFLSQFILKVDDRTLSFDYDIGETDGELMINISFRYLDDVIDLEYNESQLREKIKNINFERVIE
ncbi:MAG TPA: hypothetical protein DCR77_06645 [Flavobacteriaceae bacterium]|nr:hypothetical protein [Flavobacteriaceae bacterium]